MSMLRNGCLRLVFGSWSVFGCFARRSFSKMVVELETARDRLKLYNDLEQQDRDDTYAVRSFLWFSLVGRITPAKVFVDDWPSFSHVCSLHHSNLYSKESDRDFVVLSSSDEGGSSFVQFFQELAERRHWKHRQGAIFCYISTTLAQVIGPLVCPSAADGRIDLVEPYRHYVADGRYDFDEIDNQIKKFSKNLPANWTISSLREDDARVAATEWTHSIPEKEDYFKWLVKTFPSACVRDHHGRPMGWQQMMSFGPAGAGYFHPGFRGLGLNNVCATSLIAKIVKLRPGKRFFCIRDNNPAPLKSGMKLPWAIKRTDLHITWVIYHATNAKKVDVQSKL